MEDHEKQTNTEYFRLNVRNGVYSKESKEIITDAS